MSGRFQKRRSGNPAGRPKKRRPHVSVFDVIIDRTLTVTQNGVDRELTVDEALQLQTYQAALKGSRLAVRHVLKMIEQREVALAAPAPKFKPRAAEVKLTNDYYSADKAMRLLGIAYVDPVEQGWWKDRLKVETWAMQAALSRPGRRQLHRKSN